MNIKIDNMVDLRAFCLEQAVKIKCSDMGAQNVLTMAGWYEEYVLGKAELPETPSSFDNVLQKYMLSLVDKEKKNDEFIEKIAQELANNKNE